jgi:hypothetical protein|tara:strand:- start:7847 stop:8080 length:234 start_codon:yes stop_codon:yes gene_type:complete
MPTYTFFDEQSGMEFDITMSMSELDTYKTQNPNHKQVPSAPAIVGGVGGIGRHSDDGWKDTLKSIKKASGKGNKINV